VKYRKALQIDIDEVFLWINDPDTRAMSLNSGLIDYDDHKKWYSSKLTDDENVMVIGFEDHEQSKKSGVVRFENRQTSVRVSINLSPESRGQGVGAEFLLKSQDFIPTAWPATLLMAEIKSQNVASIKTFINAGYVLENSSINEDTGDETVQIYVKLLN